MKQIMITNNYHNTSVTLRVRNERLSERQIQRAIRALCGVPGCRCGDTFGARGPQPDREIQIERDLQNGGATVR